MTALHVLSAGAAQGLVTALQPAFEAETGATLRARFGAVGAMKEALHAGEPCDVLIVTEAMIDALGVDGALQRDTKGVLGSVRTAVAVREGEPVPDVSTAERLAAVLHAASALYFPDPERATAGIHFANVVRELGLHDLLAPRFRTFPNGATAMRALAADGGAGAVGCTQATEILYTSGVTLAGALPEPFELATAYAAATTVRTAHAVSARRFIAMLSGPQTRALRLRVGFVC